jgi:hypothetical protein
MNKSLIESYAEISDEIRDIENETENEKWVKNK